MKENDVGIEEGFYQEVAGLLKCESNYEKFPFRKRTRWNNRLPGNGRYLGSGLVRYHGPTKIHVQLYNPKLNKLFDTPEQALIAIRLALI